MRHQRRPDALAAAGELSRTIGEIRPRAGAGGSNAAQLLERYYDTDALCCMAHFRSPSTGKIRRWGNGFSCQAAAS
jgi:hypothetical protein